MIFSINVVLQCPEIADLDQVELVVESKWFTRFSGNSIAQATECDDREQATLASVNSMPRPTRASVKTWCIVYGHPSHSPDAPCMAYLPTFTPKMTQFCRKIFHTWSIWDSAMDVFFAQKQPIVPAVPLSASIRSPPGKDPWSRWPKFQWSNAHLQHGCNWWHMGMGQNPGT